MFALFFAAAVLGPSLDSPIVPPRPTIRSEIQRGIDAARDCRRFSPILRMEAYTDCIEAAHSANRQQMGTGYEAFDVGLYRTARIEMGIVVDVLRQHPDQIIDPVAARLRLDTEQSAYEAAKAALKLSDEDVNEATR